MLNISFRVDWQCVKERKQHRVLQNNKERAKQKPHTHHPRDEAMVEADPSVEMAGQWFIGPSTITQVHDNGAVQLSQTTDSGAVLQTWNIRKLRPCWARI